MMKDNKNIIGKILYCVILLLSASVLWIISFKGYNVSAGSKEIVTEVDFIDKEYAVQEFNFEINETVGSARSDKYFGWLCKIDDRFQILYSKNGKKFYRSDLEKKIRKELSIKKDTTIKCYQITQYDDVFYICFEEFHRDEDAYGYYGNPDDCDYTCDYLNYYIAETKDFKNYKFHYMCTKNYPRKEVSNLDFRENPKLYKAQGLFFYMFECSYIHPGIRYDYYDAYIRTKDPIGYYGTDLEMKDMQQVLFEEYLEYDPEIFDDRVYTYLYTIVENSKLRLLISLQHDYEYSIYVDPSDEEELKKHKTNTVYEYVSDIGSLINEGVTNKYTYIQWDLVEKHDSIHLMEGEYEKFYTIAWNDTDNLYGISGISGTDTRYTFSFPLGESISPGDYFDVYDLAIYSNIVTAKKNKKGEISYKGLIFIPLSHKQAYAMNSKGKISKIELPFSLDESYGPTCTNTKKGISAFFYEWCVYYSSDGFKTCKQLYAPYQMNHFVDIETYGNYLYVLARNEIYRLKF